MESVTFAGMPKGHIETLPSGSLRAVVYGGTDPMTGKRQYLRSRATKDRGEAYKRLARLMERAEAGRGPESRVTVGHLLDQYMAVIEVEASTRGMYEGYIRRNIRPALGDIQIRDVRGPMLDRLYAQLRRCGQLCESQPRAEIDADHECRPLAPKTVRQIHTILSGAFGAAVRWDWLERNPAESARLPKAVRRPPKPPSPEEVGKLLTAAWASHPDLAVYIWLAATTGARRGELCALRWNCVDLDGVARNYLVRDGKRIEKDTKTHQERPIALDAATCQVLDEHRERCRTELTSANIELADDAYLFSNDGGATPWNPDWTSHQVMNLAKNNGLSINVKALRHYTATQLLAAGVDIRNTAARLGHGSGGATTLRVYAHPVGSVDKSAAELLAQQLPRKREG